jgi:hypothetical protein
LSSQGLDSLLKSIRESAYPISSLEEDNVRDAIFSADVIWGYDAAADSMPLFLGKDLIADIASGREKEFGYLALLCFQIDLNSDQPEILRDTIQSLRGQCCYDPPK